MKRLFLILFCIITLFFTTQKVSAKDTVYSLNKYNEEKLDYILDSYNTELEKDGNVVAGIFLKETLEEEYDDYQIMIIKYNKKGKIKWNFTYGKNCEDKIYDFTYSYDEEGNIDGYLLVMPNTYQVISTEELEKEETYNKSPIFIKIDLKGNLIKEQSMNLEEDSIVKKIIPTYQEEKVDGYLSLSIVNSKKLRLTKYNLDFSEQWKKEYESNNEFTNEDIISHKKEDNSLNYILLQTEKKEEEENSKVLLLNKDGEIEKVIVENWKTTNNKLLDSTIGFYLYGITDEVKLKKGNDSYFVQKYNSNYEEEWEILGNVAVDKDKNISLKEQDKLFMLYTTINSSIEVVTIEKEGTETNKVKKIANDYYSVEDFNIKKTTLYFIGQIHCPEDDNCDYDKNSLFLISDEDKVIEVKEEDSTNVLLIISGIIILLIGIVTLKNKRKKMRI